MAIALLVALCGGVACGVRLLAVQSPPGTRPALERVLRPWPVVTTAAVAVIGGVSVLQLTVWPSLLTWLERDADAIGRYQLWRPFTALVTQDGGVAGLVSNLVFLAILGSLAERTLGRRVAIVSWVAGALCGELVGLWWQPIGAGNSVGSLGLVGGLAATLVATTGPEAILAAGAVAIATVVLLFGRDIHGAAVVAGALTATAIRFAPGVPPPEWLRRPWRPARRATGTRRGRGNGSLRQALEELVVAFEEALGPLGEDLVGAYAVDLCRERVDDELVHAGALHARHRLCIVGELLGQPDVSLAMSVHHADGTAGPKTPIPQKWNGRCRCAGYVGGSRDGR